MRQCSPVASLQVVGRPYGDEYHYPRYQLSMGVVLVAIRNVPKRCPGKHPSRHIEPTSLKSEVLRHFVLGSWLGC